MNNVQTDWEARIELAGCLGMLKGMLTAVLISDCEKEIAAKTLVDMIHEREVTDRSMLELSKQLKEKYNL